MDDVEAALPAARMPTAELVIVTPGAKETRARLERSAQTEAELKATSGALHTA